MKWVLNTRHYWLITSVVVVAGVVGTVSGNVDLPIPFLSALLGTSTMPAPVIPSLVVAIVAGGSIQSAEMLWTFASVRNVVAHSMALAATVVLLVFVVSFTTGILVGDSAVAVLLTRDVAGFLVLWSVARALGIERFSSLVPVVYLLIAAVFARNSLGQTRGWAWILDRDLGNLWAVYTIFLGTLLTLLFVLRSRSLLGGAKGPNV